MAVRSTTYSEGRKFGDLVIHMESLEFCTVSTKLTNPAGAGITANLDPIGQPVKKVGVDWTFVLAADIANATAVVVQGSVIPSLAASTATNAADPYLVLVNEPAIINSTKLATVDCRGSAITGATYITALETAGFVVKSEPTQLATQTE